MKLKESFIMLLSVVIFLIGYGLILSLIYYFGSWFDANFNVIIFVFIILTCLYGLGVIWAWPDSKR